MRETKQRIGNKAGEKVEEINRIDPRLGMRGGNSVAGMAFYTGKLSAWWWCGLTQPGTPSHCYSRIIHRRGRHNDPHCVKLNT